MGRCEIRGPGAGPPPQWTCRGRGAGRSRSRTESRPTRTRRRGHPSARRGPAREPCTTACPALSQPPSGRRSIRPRPGGQWSGWGPCQRWVRSAPPRSGDRSAIHGRSGTWPAPNPSPALRRRRRPSRWMASGRGGRRRDCERSQPPGRPGEMPGATAAGRRSPTRRPKYARR